MVDALRGMKPTAGHLYIDEGHSGVVAPGEVDGALGVAGHGNDRELSLELGRERSEHEGVIVSDENPRTSPFS
jgi:hypothetical protein